MGYVQMPAGRITNTTKVVISLWFRVPAASLAAGGYLMTFCAPQPIYNTDPVGETHETSGGPVFVCDHVTRAVGGYTETGYLSYVDNGDGSFSLRFNFQLADFPAVTLTTFFATSFERDTQDLDTLIWDHADEYGGYGGGGPTGVQDTGWNFDHYHADVGDFTAAIGTASPPLLRVNAPVHLATDVWHHVLLSIDVSDGIQCSGSPTFDRFDTISEGFDSFWKVYYAIDDINYNGADNLGPYFITGSDDLNAVGNDDANDIANSPSSEPVYNNDVPGPPTYASSAPLPFGANPFGIPATPSAVAGISNIDMAQLQVFTGVTLDTSIESNRRAFVTSDGTPELVAASTSLLGKTPEIYFKTSKDWILGRNRGTAGAPAPTGDITVVTPGPDLTP